MVMSEEVGRLRKTESPAQAGEGEERDEDQEERVDVETRALVDCLVHERAAGQHENSFHVVATCLKRSVDHEYADNRQQKGQRERGDDLQHIPPDCLGFLVKG